MVYYVLLYHMTFSYRNWFKTFFCRRCQMDSCFMQQLTNYIHRKYQGTCCV